MGSFVAEEPDAAARQDRCDVEDDLVEQPGVEALLGEARPEMPTSMSPAAAWVAATP